MEIIYQNLPAKNREVSRSILDCKRVKKTSASDGPVGVAKHLAEVEISGSSQKGS